MVGFSMQFNIPILWSIRHIGNIVLLIMAFTFVFITTIHAQLSPGEMHHTHAFLEGIENCGNCHSPEGNQLSGKCLVCHKVIADQQHIGMGLHAGNDYSECVLCHVEHQGRDFDLIYFMGGMNAFNHDITGYSLEESHAQIECRQCHKPENIVNLEIRKADNLSLESTFLGLNPGCNNCHFDPHRDQLGDVCQKCHTQLNWVPASEFTHDSTSFQLTGKHKNVDCHKCHVTQIDSLAEQNREYAKYKPVEHRNCNTCHDDIHNGQLGNGCRACHKTDGWNNILTASFDHDQTSFPLEGKHANLNCGKCHTKDVKRGDLKFDICMDCHSDYHEGVFANRKNEGNCEECHTVDGFRPAIFSVEHHSEGAFPLKGAHLAVPCNQCHISSGENTSNVWTFSFSKTRCRDCHSDPHNGRVDKYVNDDGCTSCHIENNWREVLFDHNSTGFTLDGKHKGLACVDCHKTDDESRKGEMAFRKLDKGCQSCHYDNHRGQFADEDGKNNCFRCHSPETWEVSPFDHTKNVRFVLDGAHLNVLCIKCHTTEYDANGPFIRYSPMELQCSACHADNRRRMGKL